MNKNRKRIMLTTAEGQGIKAEKDFLIFHTDSVTPDVFTPTWAFSDASMMTIDWGDGSQLERHATTLSHTYSYLGIKTIKFSSPDWSKLTTFEYYDGTLVGKMPSFENCVNLDYFDIDSNSGIIGNLPSFSPCTKLTYFECDHQNLSGTLPSFSNCILLDFFSCQVNNFSGNLPSFAPNVLLTIVFIYENQFSGIFPSFSTCVNLAHFYGNNNQFTDYEVGGFATQKDLAQLVLNNNLFTAQAIDAILHDLVLSLSIPNRYIMTGGIGIGGVWLDGTGNSAPTVYGMADYATLVAAGWNVNINQPSMNLTVTTSLPNETIKIFVTPTGDNCVITWGDGTPDTTVLDGLVDFTNHIYVLAGVHNISITKSNIITYLLLNGEKGVFGCTAGEISKLVSLQELFLISVPNIHVDYGEIGSLIGLRTLSIYTNIPNIYIGAGEISNLILLEGLDLESSNNFYVNAGEIGSLYATLTGWIWLEDVPNVIFTPSEIASLVNVDYFFLYNQYTQDDMDAFLASIYSARMLYADPPFGNLEVYFDDTTSIIPSGVYQNVSVPTTGLEYIYKLVNDPDNYGFQKWYVCTNSENYIPGQSHFNLTVQNAASGQTGTF
jgi:hypothetical protein